jgi:hypothetical protein
VKSEGSKLRQRSVLIGIALLIVLPCSGISIWTLYHDRARRDAILDNANEFLMLWHLPSTSEFRKVAVVRRERELKDQLTIILENSKGQTYVLWHRPEFPFITHADIPDLDRSKLPRQLEEGDATKVLEASLGKEEASGITLTEEATITQLKPKKGKAYTLLVIPFISSDGKTKCVVRFDAETGQLRQVDTRLNL